MAESAEKKHDFELTVLGRTLEHLGVQMYKRREVAIAELVANAWDAGATNVWITVPTIDAYDPATSIIKIEDDGIGMDKDSVQTAYLVVGSNRRQRAGAISTRPVMGRKGIGKLAGFGLAQLMTVATWRDGREVEIRLDVDKLKLPDSKAGALKVPGVIRPTPKGRGDHGTSVTLQRLKHVSALQLEALEEALARRFSNRVRGEMTILLNGSPVGDPEIAVQKRVPAKGLKSAKLIDGNEVKYWYAYSEDVLRSKELRGFTIIVRGKTAQAPPFFFNVEGTASGQHGTRYLFGGIEADFVDAGTDDASDIISTDRQELDWEAEAASALLAWGEKLTRKALTDWVEMRGTKAIEVTLADKDLLARLNKLDGASRKQVDRLLRSIGQISADNTRLRDLADSVLRAYEFRQFHDMIASIEEVKDDPERLEQLLTHLREWRVLESRAILEIIKGRLDIIEKFHRLVVDNAPETAKRVGADNMHDVLAGYPWILNPEWQVLAEEKSITKQLREWNAKDVPEKADRERYDFLALASDDRLVIVEIKRSGHAPTLDELQRLEGYKEKLSRGATKELHMVLVSGTKLNIGDKRIERTWRERVDASLWTWAQVFERVRKHYEHWRGLLERDTGSAGFARKVSEVQQTRQVLSSTVFRGKDARRAGLGPQDVDDDESTAERKKPGRKGK